MAPRDAGRVGLMNGNHHPGSWGQARILLVEDDPDVRETIADALGSLGWETEGAASGEDGLVACP